ncbi:hypothetical protein OIO90_006475 [Microbotryomycetes sp. JL221]|nr:hypothetical protein OIO90_006475 [Microbotryomycetes sp. JL221]
MVEEAVVAADVLKKRATTTTTRRTSTASSKAATSTSRYCTATSQCSGLTIPANSHHYCNYSLKKCTWLCNSGYTLRNGVCVKNAGTSSKTTTSNSAYYYNDRASTTTRSSTTSSRAATTTTKSTSVVCATPYTAATMISGTGTLPKPTSFVQKQGSSLTLDGSPFRMVGPNIYWLCNDENVGLPKGRPTDKGRVREALAIAVAMGSNTVRLTSCGVSVGHPWAVEPALGVFNETSFDIVDYVIYAAREYGLRVVLPMTDNFDFYHGGKYVFLRWLGLSSANAGSAFYTETKAIDAYKQYINKMMTRVNTYTGVRYGDDPTIMAYETGNELGGWHNLEGWPLQAWTAEMTSYMKSLAPKALIVDGAFGVFYDKFPNMTSPGLNVPSVDSVTQHVYPRNITLQTPDVPLAQKSSKVVFIGEFDWTNTHGGDSLSSWLSYVEKSGFAGALMWQIQGKDSKCCAFVPHTDGYSFEYPNGSSGADNMLQVVQFNYRVTGRAAPAALPGVVCPQPVF